jgi:hypothetical protein
MTRQAIPSWLDDAACAGHDPLCWDADHPDLWPRAFPICRACPVNADCAAHALGNPLASGVYAGIPLNEGTPIRWVPT